MNTVILEKVKEFVNSLDKHTAGRVIKVINRLEESESNLKMPVSRSLGGNLFELRITGSSNIRLFYCFYAGSAFVFYAIKKKSQQLDKTDLNYIRDFVSKLS